MTLILKLLWNAKKVVDLTEFLNTFCKNTVVYPPGRKGHHSSNEMRLWGTTYNI